MNSDFFIFIITVSLALSVTADVKAEVTKDLGTVGETYPVVEPDIVAQLRERAIQKSPEEQHRLIERMKKYQPADIHHLPRATKDKITLIDMTYTLDHDLIDGEGEIIYPRGYTFNPLDYVPFSGGLVIIDGNDPRQVGWFTRSPYAKNHQARLLITGGYAYELVEQLQRSVFYLTDEIAKRLHLTAVPTVIVRKGDKLQVREFFISGREHDENR